MRKCLSLLALALLVPLPFVRAQLAAPNDAGVTMGQVQLVVQDVEATKQFWATLGGVPGKLANSTFEYSEFPGVLIFWRKGEPSGGSVGSVVDHLGFYVANLEASLAKWKGAGLKTELGQRAGQAYVTTPDGLVRIEILENASLKVPIAFDHIHFYVAEAGAGGASSESDMQAWYAKVFGAKPAKRGQFEADGLPGVTLLFAKSDTPTVPTKGRALDRIGFEIKDLEAFCKKAEANGVKFNTPYRKSPTGLGVAALTDPWGTSIELNEGLSSL